MASACIDLAHYKHYAPRGYAEHAEAHPYPKARQDYGASFHKEQERTILKTNHHRRLPISTHCFICGKDNPSGLQSRFYVEGGMVILPFTATRDHCGYPDKVHGGIIAAALDECMGWAAARAIKRMCLTGELKVRYLLPVPVKEGLAVHAETISAHRRMAHTRAVLKDSEGVEYARAEGKFVPLSREETLCVDDHLVYEGGEEQVFADLRAEAHVPHSASGPV